MSGLARGRFRGAVPALLSVLALGLFAGCSDKPLGLDGAPVHLASSLDAAEIVVGEIPAALEPSRAWRFPGDGAPWRVTAPDAVTTTVEPEEDSLRVHFADPAGDRVSLSLGTGLPEWTIDDWEWVVVTLRATGAVRTLGLRFNRTGTAADGSASWQLRGDEIPVVGDGETHRYRLRVSLRGNSLADPWRHLGLHFESEGPAAVELVQVEAVPSSARYAAEHVGTSLEGRGDTYRRAIFAHAPARIRYRIRIPPGGRLNAGLGVPDARETVRFRVRVREGRREEVLLDTTWSDPDRWDQRSIDLARFAGRTVELSLEADTPSPGIVGLWAEPILSGGAGAGTGSPNVLLYVIDGGGADLMSLHGNPRPTTPFLDELATRATIFERAYSNSSWTKPATSTLLTSLQHRALGGTHTLADPLPENAVTLSEILHARGYLTAGFTFNPFAGRVSGFDRGLDRLLDAGTGNNSVSSRRLHAAFERWRLEYPGRPFFAHVQTTDVHHPYRPEGEAAGRFLAPEHRVRLREWQQRLEAAGGIEPDSPAWEATGLDREAFYEAQRLLYEECLVHNDARLAELVEWLRATGQWENTLLIVTADHGVRAAGLRLPGRMPAERVLASAYETRIPLIVSWPGRVPEGLRIATPVSLVDLMPTILDLLDLPASPQAQGRSLVPLLTGAEDLEPRPVILEELEVDHRSGAFRGLLEVIDGRWAGSLLVGDGPPASGMEKLPAPRATPFLLFDLERDPWALESVHDDYPDLTRRYINLLRETWRTHEEVAERYHRPERPNLTPEQLRSLRSLGYVQ